MEIRDKLPNRVNNITALLEAHVQILKREENIKLRHSAWSSNQLGRSGPQGSLDVNTAQQLDM
jgi:hypothetical protein